MENNPLEAALNEIIEEHPELALPATLGHVFPVLPNNIDLKIPEGFAFSREHGITSITNNKAAVEAVYGTVIIPTAIIKSDKDDLEPSVRLYFWDNTRQTWIKHYLLVDYQMLTTTKDISKLNKAMQIVVKEQQKPALANYFVMLWEANDRFENLPTVIQAQRCGWDGPNTFYPFIVTNEETIVKTKSKTLMNAIVRRAKRMPTGNIDQALEVINELQDNPVFAICLAGCLASPVVPLVAGKLDENIGIDVYGKTSAGKTAIQKLAIDLVYGMGDLLRLSWAQFKPAGMWNMARVANNLVFMLDDTHRMHDKDAGVPHDMINGYAGPKSVQTAEGWEGIDPTDSQFRGTVFFNGEVPIYSTTPNDSAGINGRIIMINHPPFPAEVNGNYVERIKKEGLDNAGHFAKPWIEHLIQIGEGGLFNQINELNNMFDSAGKDALYGRLSTKSQILVYCIREFNKLFGTTINEDKMIELLNNSMEIQTERVNVADNQMSHIIEKVFERMTGQKFNEKDCKVLNYDFKTSPFDKPDICYCKDRYLIIKGGTLEQILSDAGYKSIKQVCKQLETAGYLKDARVSSRRYPFTGNQTKDDARIQGYKFEYEDFKEFIPSDEEENIENI